MDRVSIKSQARQLFHENYWPTVFVTFLAGSAIIGGSLAGDITESCILTIVLLAIEIFIGFPLAVGAAGFYVSNYQGLHPKTNLVSVPFYAKDRFGNKTYKHTVWVMFARDIELLFWSLLLVIPGIVKAYSYTLVPYFLSESDYITEYRGIGSSYCDYCKKSEEIMRGHKWDLFVLDLSFIGWYILGLFTWDIASILYADPYRAQARAIFCKDLIDEYYRDKPVHNTEHETAKADAEENAEGEPATNELNSVDEIREDSEE